MSVETLLAGAFATLAYGTSVGIEVELPNGRRISLAAAFGPALAALGAGGYDVVPSLPLLVSAMLIELVIVVVMKRHVRMALLHAIALSASFLFVYVSGRFGTGMGAALRLSLIGGVVSGSLAYFALDVLGSLSRKGQRLRARVIENVRASLPLAVVMTSTAGLIVLVFPHLRWVSFAVMFLPVLAARHEFRRYREAHSTYHQTVSALAGLTEGAGYVPDGHHARVAQLCVKIAREFGLSSERTRELELVGLLHDVGAVSLPDASDVENVDPMVLAMSSARILEETGHLAKYAPVLREAVQGGQGASLEARILRMADAYDKLRGSRASRLRELAASIDDRELLTALSRATERELGPA